MLTLNDGRSELWQWDTGRKLTVDADCSQVHFSNKVFGRSIDVDVADGMAIIPDILLQSDKELTAWAFVGTAENGYTKISRVFKVNKRNKPADYVFTPTEQVTLKDVIDRLEDVEANQSVEAIGKIVDDYLEENPVTSPVQSVNGKKGNVVLTAEDVGALPQGTKIPKEYVLPSASTDHLGGIKAESVTKEDTQPVRIGPDGKLYTAPGGGVVAQADKSLGITGAQVGQTVRIAAVDEDGVPTAWEAVEKNERVILADFTLEEDITGYGSIKIPLSDNPFEYTKLLIEITSQRVDGSSGQYIGYIHGGNKMAQVTHLNTLFSPTAPTTICVIVNLFENAVHTAAFVENIYQWGSTRHYSYVYKISAETTGANVFYIENCSAYAGATFRIQGVR